MSILLRFKKALAKGRLGKCAQLLVHPSRMLDRDGSKTFYPEVPHKSNLTIVREHLAYVLQHNKIPKNYYALGLDRKGKRVSDYISETEHVKYVKAANSKPHPGLRHNYLCVADDKYVFAVIAESFGLPVPKTYGFYDRGQVFLRETKQKVPLADLAKTDMDVMFKPLCGLHGKGIFRIVIKDGVIYRHGEPITPAQLQETLDSDLGSSRHNGMYLIQEFIKEQHPDMAKINSGSLNTIRVNVALNPETGNYDIIKTAFNVGVGTNEVSNVASGGVTGTVLPDGHFDRYAFSEQYKFIVRHPITGIAFADCQVPFFEETLQLAKRATELFYGHKTLGWDFAYTPTGPIILEANNTWGVVANEIIEDRGWAKKIHYYFGKKK